MAQTILVVGYGPGISAAVAEKYGAEGYSVALVARNEARLAAGVESLRKRGVSAAAFPADAGNPAAMHAVVEKARATLGPIAVVQWTAYGGGEVSDLLAADAAAIRGLFDLAVVGLLATIRAALPDLQQAKGAVLVANGAYGEVNPVIDAFAVKAGAVGLALGNGAKHKLVGLLSERLKSDGVYVGEVMVAGTVKGTPWDKGAGPVIESSAIANVFWKLHQSRGDIRARITP
jgi:NAD(P)-dependent dehydrogenase (short-subunit alcohol dehydrogenase family)